MDGTKNTNLDGNSLTTLAGSEDLIVGCDTEGMDGALGVSEQGLALVRDDMGTLSLPLSPSSSSLSSSVSAASAEDLSVLVDDIMGWASKIDMICGRPGGLPDECYGRVKVLMTWIKNGTMEMATQLDRAEKEKARFEQQIRRMDAERKEMERKETERKEKERKETKRKETERKEFERMEMERKELERKEIERKETERKESERKETERKESERKETERKETERKEKERKETKTKETERKEFQRKESERMEMERKELERKEIERKEMERKETERKEKERKETKRKETERKEFERMEMERKKLERKEIERKELERKEMERKETERKETERKETERKETARKEMERKETERKEIERKELERKEMERKETERKETERKETERKEMERKETERKEIEWKETERKRKEMERKVKEGKEMKRKELERKEMERKEMERKEMERKEMLEGSDVTSISPFLIGEAFPLPPLPQRVTRKLIARNGGDLMPPVAQSPPPMVNRGFEGARTDGEACKGGRFEDGAMSGTELEWKLVGGGRRRKSPSPPPLPDSGIELSSVGNGCVERRPLSRQHLKSRPRPPISSAVMITGRTKDFSYAEALRSARKSIDLDTLGIGATRIRKATNGGLLIEVPGEDSRMKAEELVTRLRSVLKESAAVSCPIRKRELRVTGFDGSVLTDEIAKTISSFGGCPEVDVKVGPIRTFKNGLGMALVQLPVMAAAKLVDLERIRLGWTMARVELLKTRPLQCYRCWQYGHIQNMCHSTVDRRGTCFKCGQMGHVAGACQNANHCAVCYDAGLEASHRCGGPYCVAGVQQQRTLSVDRSSTRAMTQDRK